VSKRPPKPGKWRKYDPVGYENSNGTNPLTILMLHPSLRPVECPSWARNCSCKRSTDVADHAAVAPIPDSAHTSGSTIRMLPAMAGLNLLGQAASR
jgi:hypothetical protein